MTTFDHDEVEAAFRNYWALGAVGEDWDAWCDECFTEDVTYIEHILGNKQGREAVRAWIKPTMEEYGAIYTAYEWHTVAAGGRVVVYMQNRRDHPDASAAADRLPGHHDPAVRGRRQVLARGGLLVAPRGHRDGQARGRGLPRRRSGVPGPAHAARLGPTAPTGRRAPRPTPRAGARNAPERTMPELPQMQALAERIEEWLRGATFEGYVPLGFSGLKTAVPSPDELIGRTISGVGRRAKYVILEFDGEPERRVVFHLSQAGRVDFEQPPKQTKPKGSVVRWRFSERQGRAAARVRHRAQGRLVGARPGRRRAARGLGPEATSDEFAQWLRTSDDGRRVHTILRDQHTVAGVGRGYADDALHRAQLSPYASLKSLDARRARATARGDRRRARRRPRTRAHTRRRPLGEQARRALHRARQGRPAVPGVRRRPQAGVVRVARGRVLPAVPDRRQGARRPPPLPPREVAVSHADFDELRSSSGAARADSWPAAAARDEEPEREQEDHEQRLVSATHCTASSCCRRRR